MNGWLPLPTRRRHLPRSARVVAGRSEGARNHKPFRTCLDRIGHRPHAVGFSTARRGGTWESGYKTPGEFARRKIRRGGIEKMLETLRLTPDDSGLDAAAEIILAGGLVAFPTETVYGLGADATDDRAVARVFAAKARPEFNPLIAHVDSVDAARTLVRWSDTAELLAIRFWPGPLTLTLPPAPDERVSELAKAGNPTLAVRVPAHPVAEALLRRVRVPVAAPSANPSGRVSPTRASHVLDGLDGRIDAVLDAGSCGVGVESTILMPTDEGVRLLRPGGITVEAVERVVGGRLLAADGGIMAPGQLPSHYAPDAPVRLEAERVLADEVLLGFGPVRGAELNLSERGDLEEAAANLFAHLRSIDRLARGRRIAVSPIPDTGLGRAINDRLRRASAPRGASGVAADA